MEGAEGAAGALKLRTAPCQKPGRKDGFQVAIGQQITQRKTDVIAGRWRNSNKQSVSGRGAPAAPATAERGARLGLEPSRTRTPPQPTPIPGLRRFSPGFEALRAAFTVPRAQLIDEWALDMIDLIDSVKHGDYLVLADFPKCGSRRHRTFVPLSLLTPLLTTNLCKDLAWPLQNTGGGCCVHAGDGPCNRKEDFYPFNIIFDFFFPFRSLCMEVRIPQAFLLTPLSLQPRVLSISGW